MTSIAQNTTQEITGGFWVKKWDYIDGKPANSTILSCPSASGTTSVTMTIGKPDKSIIDQYFFLPALGFYGGATVGYQFGGLGTDGLYASSSPVGGAGWNRAMYSVWINGSSARIYYNQNGGNRPAGYVAGTRPDGTPWFQ